MCFSVRGGGEVCDGRRRGERGGAGVAGVPASALPNGQVEKSERGGGREREGEEEGRERQIGRASCRGRV